MDNSGVTTVEAAASADSRDEASSAGARRRFCKPCLYCSVWLAMMDSWVAVCIAIPPLVWKSAMAAFIPLKADL